MTAVWQDVGKARGNDNLRASLLLGMNCHEVPVKVPATMGVGGWVLMSELTAADEVDMEQISRDTLATERGMFEFVSCGTTAMRTWRW